MQILLTVQWNHAIFLLQTLPWLPMSLRVKARNFARPLRSRGLALATCLCQQPPLPIPVAAALLTSLLFLKHMKMLPPEHFHRCSLCLELSFPGQPHDQAISTPQDIVQGPHLHKHPISSLLLLPSLPDTPSSLTLLYFFFFPITHIILEHSPSFPFLVYLLLIVCVPSRI